jgi:hypothetical protein
MADNVPNIPTGAVPPKKETGKVQPKKETVRINLPPKPSAAPTIKLPTLPPGGQSGAPVPAAAPALASAGAATSAASRTTTAAPIAQRPGSGAPRPAAAPSAAAPALSGTDTILAIVAAVAGLLAVASTGYVAFMLGS